MTQTSPTPQDPADPNDVVLVENLDTAEDVLAAISPTDNRWLPEPSQWIYRGQRDADWHLQPSASRLGSLRTFHQGAPIPIAHPMTVREVMDAELKLIREFIVATDRAGLSVPEDSQQLRSNELNFHLQPLMNRVALNDSPEWPPTFLLSIFALAQHYGVPTRLLDWSWKPLVAAYFASESPQPAARRAIWATRVDFVETFWSSLHPRIRLVTAPQASNPNLHAQAGLFTVDGSPHERISFDDLVLREFSTIPAPNQQCYLPVLRKLTFPNSEAPRLLRLLSQHHINASTIYPGLDGVTRSLQERWRWV
jgi:FRG domain